MPATHQSDVPLGDLFRAQPDGSLQGDIPAGFTRVFAYFYWIAVDLGQSALGITPNAQRLQLDDTQQRSFWILWHWWTTFRQELEVKGDAPPSGWPRHTAEGKLYELQEVTPHSEYHFAAWTLFQCEFGETGNPHKQKELHECRIDSALYSACYYTARACIESPTHDLGSQNPANVPWRRVLDSQDLPGLHPSCHTGSSIYSCAWIEDVSELPFYLWDVKLRRTVEVKSLDCHPSYTAISHTWGRWRTEGHVNLSGVQEWSIPQNVLFDVSTLPDLLASVPVSTPFVWFDLVCIPQCESDRADQEIAKQASIFRQAAHTIIWFNGITDWRGLRLTIEWMSRIYVKEKGAYLNPRSDCSTGFFENYQYNASVSTDDMRTVGWFSSLWTLQEICLRPDMWLCNKDWELFTVGENVPVPFNTIVALVSECQQDANIEAAAHGRHQLDLSTSFLSRHDRLRSLISQGLYPRGFVELLELFDRTGMQHLHVIKKDYILLLGSQRYCESQRAEAIISVLDAKHWRSLPDPGNLVLGHYPLEFVREVAHSVGPAFFNSLSFRPLDHDTMIRMAAFSQGLLMPFEGRSLQDNESKLILNKEFGIEEGNPSIETWVIEADGSMTIPKAPILTSSYMIDNGEILGSIWLTYLEPDDHSDPHFDIGWPEGRRLRSCDIQQWCRTYHPATANFAVELSRVFGASRGLLLKETDPGSKVLYKVGNYLTSMHRHYGSQVMGSVTAVQQVDWKLL